MNADVCVETRGTWEQGFKERPVLIARDMINSSETGKRWGMFCFHQNQSTDDSTAEKPAIQLWENGSKMTARRMCRFSYCNPDKKPSFTSKLPKMRKDKTMRSNVIQDLQWAINQDSKVKDQYLWLLKYIKDPSKIQCVITSEKKARRWSEGSMAIAPCIQVICPEYLETYILELVRAMRTLAVSFFFRKLYKNQFHFYRVLHFFTWIPTAVVLPIKYSNS